MADIVRFTKGTGYLDLNATPYQLQDISLLPMPGSPSWHQPDVGERRLVHNEPADRRARLVIRIPPSAATDQDTLETAITKLRRWTEEAMAYAASPDLNLPVYLRIQRDSATLAVNHLIKHAHIDDSDSHFRAEATITKQALDIRINLTLAPYGEGDVITLNNLCYSTPHMLSDLNGDGLGNGMNPQGAPTFTMDTSTWLVGGQSQKVVTDNANSEGVYCDQVTVTGTTAVHGYIWVGGHTGDQLWIAIYGNVSGNINQKILTVGDGNGIADRTIVDDRGVTWYRVSVSGITGGTDTLMYLIAYRHGSVATQVTTFYVDAAYTGIGTQTPPAAFATRGKVYNRNDPLGTNQATENQLNYIDTSLIPGDAPAFVEHKLTYGQLTNGGDRIIAARYSEGSVNMVDMRSHINSSAFSAGSGTATAATGTSSAAWGGNYWRATDLGSGLDWRAFDVSYTGSTALSYSWGPRRIFLLAYDAGTAATYKVQVKSAVLGPFHYESPEVTIGVAATWKLLDMGTFDISHTAAPNYPDSNYQRINYTVTVDPNTASGSAYFAGLYIMPVNDEHLYTQIGAYGIATSDVIYTEGKYRRMFLVGEENVTQWLGSYWYDKPGTATNRHEFFTWKSNNAFDITDYADVQLRVTPRTTSLMGL